MYVYCSSVLWTLAALVLPDSQLVSSVQGFCWAGPAIYSLQGPVLNENVDPFKNDLEFQDSKTAEH